MPTILGHYMQLPTGGQKLPCDQHRRWAPYSVVSGSFDSTRSSPSRLVRKLETVQARFWTLSNPQAIIVAFPMAAAIMHGSPEEIG